MESDLQETGRHCKRQSGQVGTQDSLFRARTHSGDHWFTGSVPIRGESKRRWVAFMGICVWNVGFFLGGGGHGSTTQQQLMDHPLDFILTRLSSGLNFLWQASHGARCTSRFFTKHPDRKLLHEDLASFGDDQEMHRSAAFEDTAVAIFVVFDEAMEKLDGETTIAIRIFQNAGKAHAKINNFDPAYFQVRLLSLKTKIFCLNRQQNACWKNLRSNMCTLFLLLWRWQMIWNS